MAGSERLIEICSLTEQRQFAEAVELQRTIWGFQDLELIPVRLFVVANKVGGQLFGAYHGSRMVGFCIAIPGLKPDGNSYLHSHMLGVLPEYHNYGIGRMLKLHQREEALSRSIDLIEWTFDPLEIKNAYFNVERLGAIICRYVENQYGTTSSPLHGGLPTDRCIAEWWLSSTRVKAILSGQPPERRIEERITLPVEIASMRAADPKRAREIQAGLGKRMNDCFSRGLAVIGFEKAAEEAAYLLGRCE